MIGYALGEAVDRMESVARVGRRHDPLVVRLVQSLIDVRVVQASMDPIDEEVRKADEERELENVVQPERGVGGRIVQFGVSPHFSHKKRDGEDSHYRKSDGGLSDLQGDLILEVFWVREGGMVEDEEIG